MGEAESRELDWMVRTQIIARGVHTPAVIEAMRRVPRHRFVPPGLRDHAASDQPLPIGHGATISQPYVVAAMTELLEIRPGDRVLDVGTGSGYQAAVLAELGADVWSVERVPELAAQASEVLAECGYRVNIRVGDGHQGWPEGAPYAAIVVGAAPQHVPDALMDQLAIGGRLVIPVGDTLDQELIVLRRTERGFERTRQFAVLFVPLVAED